MVMSTQRTNSRPKNDRTSTFKLDEKRERTRDWRQSKGSKHDRNEARRTQYASSSPRKGSLNVIPPRHEDGDSWAVTQMLWAGIDKDAGNSVTHVRVTEGTPMLWSEGENVTVKIDKIEYDVTIQHAKYVSGHNRYTLSFDDLGVRLTVVEGQLMKLFVPKSQPAATVVTEEPATPVSSALPVTSVAIVPFGFYDTTIRATTAAVELRDALAPMRHSERDFIRVADWDFVFGTMAGWVDEDHPANWVGLAGL